MIKRILLINGSPRGSNSNTVMLTNSFLEGFLEVNQQAQVDTVILKEKNIRTCRGCFSCWNDPEGSCVLKDDMSALFDQYIAADLVVWSFPLYHFGMPSVVI